MLKKTVTYKDFNGNERTEDCYFDLSMDRVVEMTVSKDGGLLEFLDRIIKEKNQSEIIKYFKDFLRLTYGEKSDDGHYFVQNDEVFERFKSTGAYTKIFMELAFDSEAAAEFINKVIPTEVAAKIAEYRAKNPSKDPAQLQAANT